MPYKDKDAQLEAQRRHYAKHSEKVKAKVRQVNKQLRKRNKEYVDTLKSNTPCHDCGVVYAPYIMQFDHVVDGKRSAVANLVRSCVSIETIQTEIDKCELVCANCHAERTYSRIREANEGLDEWGESEDWQ